MSELGKKFRSGDVSLKNDQHDEPTETISKVDLRQKSHAVNLVGLQRCCVF